MIDMLREYKDVFALSHEDMKGLDAKFYQHQINLATDAKPIQQRRYRCREDFRQQCENHVKMTTKHKVM